MKNIAVTPGAIKNLIKTITHTVSNLTINTTMTYIDAIADTEVPSGYQLMCVKVDGVDGTSGIVYSLSNHNGGYHTVRGYAISQITKNVTVTYYLLKG